MRSKVIHFFRTPLGNCFFIYCLIFIFFFRVTWALTPVSDGDEYFYFQWLRVFLGVEDMATSDLGDNFYSSGPGLFWLPAGLISMLLAKVSGLNLDHSLWAGVALFSSLLWVGCLYLIFRIVNHLGWIDDKERVFCAVLKSSILLLNIPILYYATQRTLMSHTVELFLALLCVFLIQKRKFWLSILTAVFLSVTRYNDAPVVLLPLAVLFSEGAGLQYFKSSLVRSVSLFVVLVGALSYVAWICFFEGYDGHTFWELLRDFEFQAITNFLFSKSWGAVWIVPFWIFIFVYGAIRLTKLSLLDKAAWVWMLSGFVLCILWRENGGDFGPRYLIGTYAAALLVGGTWFKGLGSASKKVVWRVLSLSAFFMTALTAVYKSLPDTGYVGNTNFILNSIPHLFSTNYYSNQFFHTPIGSVLYYWFGVERLNGGMGSPELNPSSQWLILIMTAAVFIYVICFIITKGYGGRSDEVD